MTENLEQLKFPIGKYVKPASVSPAQRDAWIQDLATFPDRLEAALAGMTDGQLDTPYRPEGWTVRQLVHHLADSHLNAHCRTRLALTEENPVIKPYDQEEWAKLPDASKLPVDYSLQIIRGVHFRWAHLLGSLNEHDLQRAYVHPEHGKSFSVEDLISLYAHHGNNHLAQITGLKARLK